MVLCNRFDIDIATPIFVGTLRAENLKTAWTKRQEEIRIAAKPVNVMAEIALKLRENKQSLSECVESLKKLESLFRNYKNVQDFYTMGRYIVCYIVILQHYYTCTLLLSSSRVCPKLKLSCFLSFSIFSFFFLLENRWLVNIVEYVRY
jgi:hypothetical protein